MVEKNECTLSNLSLSLSSLPASVAHSKGCRVAYQNDNLTIDLSKPLTSQSLFPSEAFDHSENRSTHFLLLCHLSHHFSTWRTPLLYQTHLSRSLHLDSESFIEIFNQTSRNWSNRKTRNRLSFRKSRRRFIIERSCRIGRSFDG